MFERSWVPLLAKGNRYYNFFEYFRLKFTFLECERHQNISYIDDS